MSVRVARAIGARLALPAVLIAVTLAAGDAAAQQPPAGGPPPTTEQLRQAIEEIRRRLARPPEAQAPAETALAAELKAANARIAELTDTLGKLRAERDGLMAEIATARSEGQRLGQALSELDARAQALDRRVAELAEERAREVARLNAELAAARAGAEQADRATAELERLREEAASVRAALVEAREQAERAGRQRAERESELAGLLGRVGELQQALAEAREQARGQSEAAARRIEELSARLATADAAVARLEGEAEELRSIAATSVGELQSLGEQLLRVLADNLSLQQTVEQVRTARELAVAEAAAARRDAELYAAEAARLRGQLAGSEPALAAIAPAAAPAKLEAAADGLGREPDGGPALSRDQLAELRAVEAPDGTVVTVVEGTAFQFGSEQLTEAAGGSLLRLGRLIDLVQPQRIRFVGHTDSQGDETANRRLSQRRAQAVRDWLVRNRGLDAARTRVEGRGPDQPIASNDTPEGRRANRRVEVVLEPARLAR